MLSKKKLSISHFKGGFERGINQLPLGKIQEVKAKLMKALGVGSRTSYISYKKGYKNNITIAQIEAVEAVFAEYGIVENIWGKHE